VLWEPPPSVLGAGLPISSLTRSAPGHNLELLRKPRLFIRVLRACCSSKGNGPFISCFLAGRTLGHDFIEEILRGHAVLI
jgi:hypothetical protein